MKWLILFWYNYKGDGFLDRSGYSPGGRASKNYLPGRRVNNLLLARQRK